MYCLKPPMTQPPEGNAAWPLRMYHAVLFEAVSFFATDSHHYCLQGAGAATCVWTCSKTKPLLTENRKFNCVFKTRTDFIHTWTKRKWKSATLSLSHILSLAHSQFSPAICNCRFAVFSRLYLATHTRGKKPKQQHFKGWYCLCKIYIWPGIF